MGFRSKNEPEFGERVWQGRKDSTEEDGSAFGEDCARCTRARDGALRRVSIMMARRGRGSIWSRILVVYNGIKEIRRKL